MKQQNLLWSPNNEDSSQEINNDSRININIKQNKEIYFIYFYSWEIVENYTFG